MAYTGFLSDPNYTRRNVDEQIDGNWIFENSITFKKVIQGTTIAAYYGDIAENYLVSDIEIIPEGSIVKLGGTHEITKTESNDRNVFGVISTKPGIILNQEKTINHLPVVLNGRVPIRIIGPIKKFDKITTSSIHGVGKKKNWLDVLLCKPTVGVALQEDSEKNEKLIEMYTKSRV